MEDEFTPIEDDRTPLESIGVAESVVDLLAVKGISDVGDLVTEFRKPQPFDEIIGIGDVKRAHLERVLLEHRARCCDPRMFVRLLLNRSQALNYVLVPAVVGLALLVTHLLGLSKFNRDDIGTILASLVALLAFDLGRWSRAPAILKTPLSTSRCRTIAVLLVVAATRVAVSEDYGWTEALRYLAIGTVLGMLDALRSWAQNAATKVSKATRQTETNEFGRRVSELIDGLKKLHPLVQGAILRR